MSLQRELCEIHSKGQAGITDPFRALVPSQKKSPPGHKKSLLFRSLWDEDRERFNRLFGTQMLTYRLARKVIAEQEAGLSVWYAPIDFGLGLTVGPYWSTDSGTGRWEFFNSQILEDIVRGATIVDLGSNNGLGPLMMLKLGARRVIGIEKEMRYAKIAEAVHGVMEWMDMTNYDFTSVEDDMLSFVHREWDTPIDVVTAFCSLYYLEEIEMARVVRQASTIAPTIVLQGSIVKGTTRLDHSERRANPVFLRELLLNNGFSEVAVHAPAGFSRPLLVGRRG